MKSKTNTEENGKDTISLDMTGGESRHSFHGTGN